MINIDQPNFEKFVPVVITITTSKELRKVSHSFYVAANRAKSAETRVIASDLHMRLSKLL